MTECRNCGSQDLVELGFIGRIEPFFLKRVFNIEMRIPIASSPLKQFVRTLGRPLRKPLSKVYSKTAFLEMQSCKRCSFVQSTQPFLEDSITRLYLDYRSETYNVERIHYEPSYAAIASQVGTDEREVTLRLNAATGFLAGKLEMTPEFTMLDYGGADGRFLPPIAERRYVYEISDIAPIAGVQRIASTEDLGQYSYVHLAHVLEHVVYPLELVKKIASYVADKGYLYIEVPQEISDENLRCMQQGSPKIEVAVHEHINFYSIAAVTQLIGEAGLDVVAVEVEPVDVGWARGNHVRALGRKR